jgi:hypothetical protein
LDYDGLSGSCLLREDWERQQTSENGGGQKSGANLKALHRSCLATMRLPYHKAAREARSAACLGNRRISAAGMQPFVVNEVGRRRDTAQQSRNQIFSLRSNALHKNFFIRKVSHAKAQRRKALPRC